MSNFSDFKAKGKEAVDRREWAKAIAIYSKAILAHPSIEDQKQLSILYANRSFAYSSSKNFELALAVFNILHKDSEEAIKLLPEWAKGYLRKSEALFGLCRYIDCMIPLSMCLSLEPQNLLFKRRMCRVKACIEDDSNGLEIHQLSLGKDLGKKGWFSPVQNMIYDYGMQLKNFIYIIVNTESKQCLVVDACWDIDGILEYINQRQLKLVGAIVTHYHIDHVGGIPPEPFDMYRIRVDGVAKLISKLNIPIYAHELEIESIIKGNPEMNAKAFIPTTDNQIITLPIGKDQITGCKLTVFQFMHTPGHTPGSQCFIVNGNRLFSGDVLFIKSHGRTDFPDSSQDLMNCSLRKLKDLNGEVLVYCGHDYGIV